MVGRLMLWSLTHRSRSEVHEIWHGPRRGAVVGGRVVTGSAMHALASSHDGGDWSSIMPCTMNYDCTKACNVSKTPQWRMPQGNEFLSSKAGRIRMQRNFNSTCIDPSTWLPLPSVLFYVCFYFMCFELFVFPCLFVFPRLFAYLFIVFLCFWILCLFVDLFTYIFMFFCILC